MEALVKFCPPKFNILNGCNTIRFGTLEDYRDSEHSDGIADENEGKESTDVDLFQTDNASNEAMETVKKVFPFPLGEHCRIQGGSLEATFANCFIWCCSRASRPISREQGTRMDPTYTDFYEIADGDSFGRHLTQLLNYFICGKACSNSTHADIAKDCFKDLPVGHSMNKIIVHMVHDDVKYVDEKKSLIDNSQLYSYDQSKPFEYRSLFVKTKEYEYQQEHRFVFFLLNKEGNLLLGVRKKPIELRIDPVTRHLIDQVIVADHDE